MKQMFFCKNVFIIPVIRIALTGLSCAIILSGCAGKEPSGFTTVDREPSIFPDYHGVTIPPNICPLNFRIDEEGSFYRVLLSVPHEK